MTASTPKDLATQWLARFGVALASGDKAAAAAMFGTECFWRDMVAFTWTIKTLEGQSAIAAMLDAQLAQIKPAQWTIIEEPTEANGIVEAWFTFETAVARGKGHLRLKGDKAWTLLTTMTELKGFEEKRGPTRPLGVRHGSFKDRTTWLEERKAEEAALGHTQQPYCVIIGGGQGGIMLGARLKRLGVPTIILEKNPRAGDSWRNRYRSLVLHDPIWYDHLPYLPFPDHWPVFTPKDQLGDWLEMYAMIMELNYWGGSACTGATYDEAKQEWAVRVQRDGTEIVLRPKQLVFATGSYGPPHEITLPGQGRFKGTQYHSSKHVSGEGFAGKRAIVIGSNSSAHDICVDLWEHDADVTMIQRSPTTVVKSDTLMKFGFEALYSEAAVAKGIDVDKADLIAASMPYRLVPAIQVPLYERIQKHDADFYARLRQSGMLLDFGEDNSGLMLKAMRTGSGYYIDVGGSDLIASGKIKVKAPVEVKEIHAHSVTFTDGSTMDVDLIVYATGYRPMNGWVAQLVSQEAAGRIGPNWGYGSGVRGDPGPWLGEQRNMWKPLAHPNLWFHGGNLALSRFHSLHVALQLKARMEDVATPVFQ